MKALSKLSRSQRRRIKSEKLAEVDKYIDFVENLLAGDPIEKRHLINTPFEKYNLQKVNRLELIAIICRKGLSIDPNNTNLLNNLGISIARGCTLDTTDLLDPSFKGRVLHELNHFEVAAMFFRKAIRLYEAGKESDSNGEIYANLARCLERGVRLRETDLVNTPFEKASIEQLELNDFLAYLYRKAARLNCKASNIFNLAKYLKKGASILKEDLQNTSLKDHSIYSIDPVKLIAELYRNIIARNEDNKYYYYLSLYYLANYIFAGMAFDATDLLGTRFEGQDITKVNQIEAAAALYRKIIANAKDCFTRKLAISQLAICLSCDINLEIADLKGTSFEGTDLENIDEAAFIAELSLKGYHEKTDSIDSIWSTLNSKTKEKIEEDLPSEFMCPISYTLMQAPVYAADGKVYDEKQITRWIYENITDEEGEENTPKSPLTNEPLQHLALMPNIDLTDQITAYLKQKQRSYAPQYESLAKKPNPNLTHSKPVSHRPGIPAYRSRGTRHG